MRLNTPVIALNHVGPTLQKRLGLLGIHTVKDLLYHFPFRYEDFQSMSRISSLHDGVETTVRGKIEVIGTKRSPRKRTMITEAVISDGEDRMRIVWFGQPFIAKILKVGDEVFFSGKVKDDMFGLQMVSPGYEKVSPQDAPEDAVHTARIVPIYPLTRGITEKQLRTIMKQAMDAVSSLDEWIPEDIRDQVDIMGIGEAIQEIHFPHDMASLHHAERRLKFDELFLLQLRAEMIRQAVKRESATPIPFQEGIIKSFVSSLPFELTKAQRIAAWEILQDMEKTAPMNRLLEGDVGSGKTVVAAMAALDTMSSGLQAAIMAPTEILAKQHFVSFQNMLPDKKIVLMTSADVAGVNLEISSTAKKKRRAEAASSIKDGNAELVIGTHALLTDDVQFRALGLVVVDEQHRFGVDQRKTIRAKSGNPDTMPHFLSMTATPIPRSFALTLYGDLDISIINELPKGRKPIETSVIDAAHRAAAYGFIKEQVEEGRQVFVICPLISNEQETNDKKQINDRKSVLEEYEKLSNDIFPTLRVGYLHGKMKKEEKDTTMNAFIVGEIDILVSTSVVEVGVNIPNATVMMIEGAEFFGLAQLHQFRGRVGRSDHQSYCFLFTESFSRQVKDRLSFFSSTTDGFKVAEYDLEMRGPGEVYGTMQSGMSELKFATMQDGELIKLARGASRDIDFDTYKELKHRVEEWEQRVHLE